jgi:hypothetical protein
VKLQSIIHTKKSLEQIGLLSPQIEGTVHCATQPQQVAISMAIIISY